jgi:hypothetical protein
MTVVYYDTESGEHITIENVWKIERSINHIYLADGIKVYYLKKGVERKGIRIPNEYVTSITV